MSRVERTHVTLHIPFAGGSDNLVIGVITVLGSTPGLSGATGHVVIMEQVHHER